MKKATTFLLSICFVAFLFGCATTPTRFCHPTKSQEDFNRDIYDCEGEVKQRQYHSQSQSRTGGTSKDIGYYMDAGYNAGLVPIY